MEDKEEVEEEVVDEDELNYAQRHKHIRRLHETKRPLLGSS